MAPKTADCQTHRKQLVVSHAVSTGVKRPNQSVRKEVRKRRDIVTGQGAKQRELTLIRQLGAVTPTLPHTACELTNSRPPFATRCELTAVFGCRRHRPHPPTIRGGHKLNVVKIDDARSRRVGFETQRQRAVDALRLAAVEFRKLEDFTSERRKR